MLGDNLTFVARGDSDGNGGDVNVRGSQLGNRAKGNLPKDEIEQDKVKKSSNINIEAKRDFNLLAGKNSNESHSEESSHSASIGASASLGTNGVGYSFDASGSVGMGSGNTRTTTWQASEVNAESFTVKTGGNANITGSKIKADKVKADIGGDLKITSLQDEQVYNKKNHAASMGGSIGPTSASANAGYNQDKIESKYKSVNEQAGIFAGSGGYDIEVGGRTELVGAVIASEAEDKSNNKLSTASIGFKDIKNEASFSVDSFSAGASVGTNGFNMNAPSAYHNGSDKLKEKDKTSQTQSAVEAGTLVIRDNDKQTQSIDELSRNTKDAHKKLAEVFNEKKELERKREVELVKEITAQTKELGAKIGKVKDKYFAGDKVENESKATGTGSTFNKRVDQAAAILTGVLTGDYGSAASGVLAPEVAGLIKRLTYEEDEHGNQKTTLKNLLSHALGGAALAGIAGNDVLAGAAGAAGGELVADLIRKQVYGNKSNSELTEEEKQTISHTAQFLTSFAAGAVSGEDGNAISTSMDAAKNSVEYNRLMTLKEDERIKELANNNEKAYLYYAAACALINCSKEYADDDPAKKELQKLEEFGNSEVLAKYREELKEQKYTETVKSNYYVPRVNGGYDKFTYNQNVKEDLFQYSFSDRFVDNVKSVNNQYSVTTRLDGVVQSGFGAVELAGSATLSPGCISVVGCVPSAMLGWDGLDNIQAGARQAWTGKVKYTYTAEGISKLFNVSKDTAELIASGATLGVGGIFSKIKHIPAKTINDSTKISVNT